MPLTWTLTELTPSAFGLKKLARNHTIHVVLVEDVSVITGPKCNKDTICNNIWTQLIDATRRLLSYDDLFIITLSFLTRWLGNFAKNHRYPFAMIWNTSISLLVNIFLRNKRISRSYCLKKMTSSLAHNFLMKFLVSAFIDHDKRHGPRNLYMVNGEVRVVAAAKSGGLGGVCS